MEDLDKIIDACSSFAAYLEDFMPECRERDNAITKLQEAVFWLTFFGE